MLYGLLGMLTALVIFVLVAVFGRRSPDPKIAQALEPPLIQAGFVPLATTDALRAQVEACLRQTGYIGFIERLYRRPTDGALLCWTLDSQDTNHHVIAVIPQSQSSAPWILALLPHLEGRGDGLVEGLLRLSLKRLAFVEARPAWLAALGAPALWLVKKGAPPPPMSETLLKRLASHRPLILRSNGSLILLERLTPSPESIQDEAQEVLRLRDSLAPWL